MPGACDRRATPRGGMLRRPIRERTYEMEYLGTRRAAAALGKRGPSESRATFSRHCAYEDRCAMCASRAHASVTLPDCAPTHRAAIDCRCPQAGSLLSPTGPYSSLNGVAECSRVVSHPSVPRDDRHERGRFGQDFCRGQMHGVERPNGFHRERAADTRKDIVGHTDDVATAREDLESTSRGAFVRLAQSPAGARAKDGAGRLGERHRGRDPRPLRANRCSRRPVALQQRRDQRTRFNVAGRQRGVRRRPRPPSGSANPATRRCATLRHGRCRSRLRRYRPATGCQASLRAGRRPRARAE